MQVELFGRLLFAGVCGALIGYERKNRMKEAGIRTHFVVGIGAALMMIVSKYGFQDELGKDGIALDPSRIAAQVVSGVSFLGAGMIFLQRQTIKGLTTAAGIWTTAGMGLAIGAGLYWVGVAVTLLLLAGQKLLHGPFGWLAAPKVEQIELRVADESGVVESIRKLLADQQISIVSFHAEKHDKEEAEIELQMSIKLPNAYRIDRLLSLIQDSPAVKAVDLKSSL
ncbi:MgtC/SapB family protein [Paenibacillus sp. MBLB4367]|uniref:MgtC/SapB family protein n=1 Tax=Paenibacillus sp. MBLB4367 TaxID=3384767 RepID=UPI0039081A08